MRRSDVKFTLQLLLRVIKCQAANNGVTAAANNSSRLSNSVKIGFLGQYFIREKCFIFCKNLFSGLRILLTCYEENLTKDWMTIAGTIRYGLGELLIVNF